MREIFPQASSSQLIQLAIEIQKNQHENFERYNLDFPYWEGQPISLKNFEHAFCEFFKYISLRKGIRGRSRPKKEKIKDCPYRHGEIVQVKEGEGTIRYIGQFGSGKRIQLGIELNEPSNLNDNSQQMGIAMEK